MERVDTKPPFGSITLEEWIAFNLSPDHFEILSGQEWDARLSNLFPTKQDIDSVVSHDREGFPTYMKEQDFLKMYKMGKLLGKGKYASVHLCTYNPTKEKRAMKIFSKRGQGGTKDKIYKIIKEAIYTRRAAHPHVTEVHDLIETKERLLIIFEVVEGGELYKEVLRRKHFSEVII